MRHIHSFFHHPPVFDMALASSASAQHFVAHDTTPCTSADPFWQSTPRTNSAGLASLISAIQQVCLACSTFHSDFSIALSKY